MITMDYVAIAGLVMAAIASAVTFGKIATYLFDHNLAYRNAPPGNLLVLYRKYKDHTRETTGQVNSLRWVHAAAAGTFITIGVAYTLARFIFKWTL